MSSRLRAGGIFVVGFLSLGAFQAVTGLLDPKDDSTSLAAASDVSVAPGKVPAQYQDMINNWGRICPELSPALLAAQINQESGWNPRAGSSAGAQGIAQFMPGTWSAHGIDANKDGRTNVWDPEDAIPSAAVYDCYLAKHTRSVGGDGTRNMLAAYNAGLGAVQRYGGIPPYRQTRNYVAAITAASRRYQ